MQATVLIRLLSLLALVCQCLAGGKFALYHFNDLHARIEPDNEYHGHCNWDDAQKGRCAGGLARMKTFLDRERAKGKPMLVLNAGDDFIGTMWDHHFKGEATAHFLNQMGIDAMALGNHEFDYGPDVLLNYVKKLKFPVLCANLHANGHALGHYVKPYITKYIGGMKVGICGVLTKGTMYYSKAHPVYFSDTKEAARKCVRDLKEREGVNIIILLSHTGFNADRAHAQLVPDVDIIVGGHSHAFLWNWQWGSPPAITHKHGHAVRDHVWSPYPAYEWARGRKIPVLQAGWGGRYLGRAYCTFDDEGELTSFSGQPVLLGGHGSDNYVHLNGAMEADIKSWKWW